MGQQSFVYENWARFAALFDGLKLAHGTGKGEWVKRPLRPEDWTNHLLGRGPGIGVAPLREDNTVMFAAIDLDEPDFDAAREMQGYIPGTSWIERSRSGNAHVWVFFSEPCPAWLAMSVLREATLAAGKKGVEVFPKNHDFERVRFGNYINLPYYGSTRTVDYPDASGPMALDMFLTFAEDNRTAPADWRRRAALMQIGPPTARENRAAFGEQKTLHVCAQRIIDGAAGPITEGHRNAVFFMLAKCLMNWTEIGGEAEALEILYGINDDLCSPPESAAEIRRILGNVTERQYTSTGCDDPLVASFADPSCPIANPRS